MSENMAKKKITEKKIVKNYQDLFYMTPSVVQAKDIYNILHEIEGLVTELWADMNVLEVVLKDGNVIDFEPLKAEFQDPSDMAFLKNRKIQTIFSVTVCDENMEEMIPYFVAIVEQLGGFLCSDSDDFRPFLVEK